MTQLQFQKVDGLVEASFTADGPVMAQVHTASAAKIYVYASLDGMPRALLFTVPNYYGSAMFPIRVPMGAVVTLRTAAEVKKAVLSDTLATPADPTAPITPALEPATDDEVRGSVNSTLYPAN